MNFIGKRTAILGIGFAAVLIVATTVILRSQVSKDVDKKDSVSEEQASSDALTSTLLYPEISDNEAAEVSRENTHSHDISTIENVEDAAVTDLSLDDTKDKSVVTTEHASGLLDGYDYGSEVIEYAEDDKFRMFYLTKKDNDEWEAIRNTMRKILSPANRTKDIYTDGIDKENFKNKPFVYVKTGGVKEGNLTDKMIKNIPRQGWKDFILSLPEDDWKDKTVIFISREGSIVEPSPLPDQVDYTASHLEWIAVSQRTEKPTFTLISKPKYIYDQIIEGRGNKKARYIQFKLVKAAPSTPKLTINWSKAPKQFRIDECTVVHDNAADIVKLFDAIQDKKSRNPLEDALKLHGKSYAEFKDLKILIICP